MGDLIRQMETEIRSWISSGALRPGDKLPSERELAARFSAARTTVRLALMTLCAQHLVDARHGSGYFVRAAAVTDPVPWTVHGQRTVYDSPWVQLALVDVEPAGVARFEHHVVKLARVAVTAVLDTRDQVLMLRRYRFVPRRSAWELPGGIVEEGEDGADAAAREVLEETGWAPGPLRHLLTFQPQVGMVDSPHELYLAKGGERVAAPQGGEEAGTVAWVPLREIPAMMARDELAGSGTLIALLHIIAFGPQV